MSVTRVVPCGSCRLCCYGEAIVLHPEDGDKTAEYKTRTIPHPLQPWRNVQVLEQRREEDGRWACVYLGESGCTIWDRRPAICRSFDCRLAFKKIPARVRTHLLEAGKLRSVGASATNPPIPGFCGISRDSRLEVRAPISEGRLG